MNRREFIYNFSIAAGTAACLPGCSINPFQRKQPNILFLFADDQCHAALSALGSEVQTPNLDRLAAEGVTFTNAYNQGGWHGAVCVASRTMFNTGRFLWNAYATEKNLDQEAEQGRLWSQLLNQAGYDTYMAGKWHVKTDAQKLFSTTGTVRKGGMPNQVESGYNRPLDKDDYENGWKPWDTENDGFWKGGKHWSEVLADEGIGFLKNAAESRNPFFMYLAFNAPHDPRQAPREYVEQYPWEKIDTPDNFLEEYPYKDEIGCPATLRDERLAPFPRTEFAVKVNRQEYYAIITHLDAQIGRLLDSLDKSGLKESTHIIFTADHGLACGQHGLLGKQNMFEHSVKAHLIISGPRIPENRRIDSPVYIQDIMPTTLALAKTDLPDHVQFRSLLPLITGKREKQYDAIYGAYRHLQRMVRKDNYKLIYYPKIQKKLLFNLDNDAAEMHNLADMPEYNAVVADLWDRLLKLQTDTGDTLQLPPYSDEGDV